MNQGGVLNRENTLDAGAWTMVFGSNMAGLHREASAGFAVRHFGAEEGVWDGPTGASYAIPYRSPKLELLPLQVIAPYVRTFVGYAAEKPGTVFRVMRFGCGVGQHSDADLAALFRDAPANVGLSGVWERELDAGRGPRILISDPTDALLERATRSRIYEHLAPYAAAPHAELVSIEGLSNLSADRALARALALEHRVVGLARERYGVHAQAACEVEAVWLATYLLVIGTSLRRTQPMQIRLVAHASREGLKIEELSL